MRLIPLSIIATAALIGSAVSLPAEYVLVLKNGRQITVLSYREEGSMIKFQGFGGEIGISKDQIQTVRKVGREGPLGLDVTAPEAQLPPSSREMAAPQPESAATEESGSSAEERQREASEYQEKLVEITERLKAAQDRYSQAIRDTSSPQPSQLVSPAQVEARQEDVISRFKDAQYNPSEPAPVSLLENSPFISLPPTTTEVQPTGRTRSPYQLPPNYTAKQQELLDLRNQAIQLDNEREQLINEMKKKDFDSVKILE
jgi:hypothetical protein